MQNRLVSAKKWLSSTAIRLFSSSNDSIGSSEAVDAKDLFEPKRRRGRPRKDSNFQKTPKFDTKRRQLGRRRLSVAETFDKEESGPNDGETRFLLTLKALPRNLQILAKSAYPSLHNKYEEHRITCKIINDEQKSKPHEIFIPTFRKLSGPRTRKDNEKGIFEKERISDEECLQRHRPLELVEKRERKREEELVRYELYIKKLSKEYPELLNRKYPITSDSSISSLDY